MRSPERSALATSSTVSAGTTVRRPTGRGGHGPVDDSDQEASAGRTRVATHPGRPHRRSHRVGRVRRHVVGPRASSGTSPTPELAMDAMSDCSGAS